MRESAPGNRTSSRPPPGLEELIPETPAVQARPVGLVTGGAGQPADPVAGRQSPPRRPPGLQEAPQGTTRGQPEQNRQPPSSQQQPLQLHQHVRPPPQQPPGQQFVAQPGNSQVAAWQAMAQEQVRNMQAGSWPGNGAAPGALPPPNSGSMLPTPLAPNSVSPWSPVPTMPSPASAGYQHQAPPGNNSLKNRQQVAAATASLQKFAAAAEVRRAADAQAAKEQAEAPPLMTRSSNHGAMSPSADQVNEQEVQKRIAAQVQAEKTAARIQAERRGTATAGNSPSKDQEASEDIVKLSDSGDVVEKRYVGRIKNYNVVQGFGFIQCPEIMTKYGCDAFLNHAVDGGIVVGGAVSFAIELNKNGKPQARRVKLEDPFAGQEPKKITADNVPTYTAFVGQVHTGRIKSFNSNRGFGFISSPDLPSRMFNGRDVYVSRAQAPSTGLWVGQEVTFTLVIDRDGQPQARDVAVQESRKSIAPVGRQESIGSFNLFN